MIWATAIGAAGRADDTAPADDSSPAPRSQTAEGELALCEERFTVLYRAVARPLAAYVRRTVGNAEEARDVVQETFFRYLRAGAPAGADPETARPYLYRTATHLLRDHWRRAGRDRAWRQGNPEPRPAAPRDRGLAHDLDRALRRLRPRDRALLWLAHVEEASHREIAAVLDVGEASVRVMLFRARKRLETVLEDSDFPTEDWR